MLRLINVQNDLFRKGLSLEPAIHIKPIEWLTRHVPYPSHLVQKPSARPQYAFDPKVQTNMEIGMSCMESLVALRRRDRIEQIVEFPPVTPSNCPTFVDYLLKYPLKVLNEFFNTIKNSFYGSDIEFEVTPETLTVDGL